MAKIGEKYITLCRNIPSPGNPNDPVVEHRRVCVQVKQMDMLIGQEKTGNFKKKQVPPNRMKNMLGSGWYEVVYPGHL